MATATNAPFGLNASESGPKPTSNAAKKAPSDARKNATAPRSSLLAAAIVVATMPSLTATLVTAPSTVVSGVLAVIAAATSSESTSAGAAGSASERISTRPALALTWKTCWVVGS